MKNKQEKKIYTNTSLVVLGLLSTIAIGLGIWQGEELILNAPNNRDVYPLEDRDMFSENLKLEIQKKFSEEFCSSPSDAFASLNIGSQKFQTSRVTAENLAYFPNIEQEAIRRCERTDITNERISTCFVFSPKQTNTSPESFMAADQVLVELSISFRDARSHRIVACKDIARMTDTNLELYFSVYWPFVKSKNQLPHYRITGGISSPLREADKLLSF